MRLSKEPYSSSPVMHSFHCRLYSTCTWSTQPNKHQSHLLSRETNSNYHFCYVSLVQPFVLLQRHGYGKQFNLYVGDEEMFVDGGKCPNPHFTPTTMESWAVHTSAFVVLLSRWRLIWSFLPLHWLTSKQNLGDENRCPVIFHPCTWGFHTLNENDLAISFIFHKAEH